MQNIGNNDERSILELAQTVIKITGSNSNIIFEKKDDAPLHRRPDISLAKKILNWEPTTLFEENISKTIDYYKSIGLPDKKPVSRANYGFSMCSRFIYYRVFQAVDAPVCQALSDYTN